MIPISRVILTAASLALATTAAHAQYAIAWSTIDGGGGTSTSATFSLSGTIAQPDAGLLAGPNYSCSGGFWISTPAAPRCVADFDDGSGTGTPDGGVTIDDLLFYLVIFNEGVVRADVDDGSGTNTPDGGVTIDDLLYFLLRYANGC